MNRENKRRSLEKGYYKGHACQESFVCRRCGRLVTPGGAGSGHSDTVFLCAVCAHRPGALLGLLKIFGDHSLNLTRIESRPVKEAFGQYRFFIEFAGDIGSDEVKSALSEAEGYCSQFKLLGAYHSPRA